jgi:hypothetical protein
MSKRSTGRYERTTVGGEEVAAFVPASLPPADPSLVLDSALGERLRAAEHALTRLELAGEMVPSLDWFIYEGYKNERKYINNRSKYWAWERDCPTVSI